MTYPNQLHQTNFRLEIPDNGATLDLVIAVQRATIPNIEIEPAQVMINRQTRGNLPGSGVTFTPLMVMILLDEDMKAYGEMYKWLISTCDWKSGKSTGIGPDASMGPKNIQLHILDNSKQKIVATYTFIDAWPSSLGEVELSYADEGNMAVTCQVMFQYKYMEFSMNGVTVKPSHYGDVALGMHPSLR